MLNTQQKELKKLFHYEPETGIFTYKRDTRMGSKAGEVAGWKSPTGYLTVSSNLGTMGLHRLAFLYMEGYLPENDVDHIDRNKTNNKWSNLREVTRGCNLRNTGNRADNTSGVKGVCGDEYGCRWRVRISYEGKGINIGYYDDFDEAVCARLAFEQCLGWAGCNSSSPAFKHVQKMLNR